MEKASEKICPVMSTAKVSEAPGGQIIEVRCVGRRCMLWKKGALAEDAPPEAGYCALNGTSTIARTSYRG